MKKFEDCDHDWKQTRVYWEECEEYCFRCGATRKGHIAWGDWEEAEEE